MADKTARGEQEQATPAAGAPAAPETTPQQALNESKEAGTGGAYVAPEGAAAEGATSEVFEIAVLPLLASPRWIPCSAPHKTALPPTGSKNA